jgi:hypothetical protein
VCPPFLRRYALGLFLWRDSMIRNKSKGPYDDKKGPILLVVTLSVVLIITLWYTSITSLPGPKVLPNPRDFNLGFKTSAGVCDQLLANRADLLQTGIVSASSLRQSIELPFDGLVVPPLYRPNFAVAHTGLNMVLVGAGSQLTVLDASKPASATQLQLNGQCPIVSRNRAHGALARTLPLPPVLEGDFEAHTVTGPCWPCSPFQV